MLQVTSNWPPPFASLLPWSVSVVNVPSVVVRVQDENAYRAARKALQEHRPEEALALFRAQDHSASPLPWSEVEVEACVGARQLPKTASPWARPKAHAAGWATRPPGVSCGPITIRTIRSVRMEPAIMRMT